MIIDSGSDLLWLTARRLWKHEDRSPLIVVAMSGDLELYFVKTVTKHYSGCLDDYHEAILRAIDKDYVRYFAVAHRSRHARAESVDYDASHRLEQEAAKLGLQLISELYVEREYWCSTGPMYTFKTYFRDELPKLITRRPRKFAKTRLAGGGEVAPPDDSVYQRFSYELDDLRTTSLPEGVTHD